MAKCEFIINNNTFSSDRKSRAGLAREALVIESHFKIGMQTGRFRKIKKPEAAIFPSKKHVFLIVAEKLIFLIRIKTFVQTRGIAKINRYLLI